MTAQVLIHVVPFRSLDGLFRRLRGTTTGPTAAHDARRRHMTVADREIGDTGLSRDEVVGTPDYQSELPFFMQRGFGAHRV